MVFIADNVATNLKNSTTFKCSYVYYYNHKINLESYIMVARTKKLKNIVLDTKRTMIQKNN